MKYLAAAAASLAALPAAAHQDGHLPVHLHPHGSELTLIVPAVLVVGLGLFMIARR